MKTPPDPIDPKTQWTGTRPKRHKTFPADKEPIGVWQTIRSLGKQLEKEETERSIEAYKRRQAELKALAAQYVLSPKKKQKEKRRQGKNKPL